MKKYIKLDEATKKELIERGQKEALIKKKIEAENSP